MEIDEWWGSLTEAVRAELTSLWDEDSDEWARLLASNAIVLEGRFVDPEDRADTRLARRELREYINNHDVVFYLPDGSTHHICSAHQRARDVVKRGLVPSSFACPFRRLDCPIRSALARASGRAIQLCEPARA